MDLENQGLIFAIIMIVGMGILFLIAYLTSPDEDRDR